MGENNRGVDFNDTGTGNWNVAKPYTSDKILKWLVLIDDYHTIAIFGYSNLESDVFMRDNNLKNTARLNALKRLIHAMLNLIRNTKFAVKKAAKDSFDTYRLRLLKIEGAIPRLREEKKRGNKITELNVNEKLFEMIMDEISGMIDDINTKLNEANLIFTHIEDFDPKKMKEGFKEKYVNRT